MQETEQALHNRRCPKDQKQVKQCSHSLDFKKMQIRIMGSYHNILMEG